MPAWRHCRVVLGVAPALYAGVLTGVVLWEGFPGVVRAHQACMAATIRPDAPVQAWQAEHPRWPEPGIQEMVRVRRPVSVLSVGDGVYRLLLPGPA